MSINGGFTLFYISSEKENIQIEEVKRLLGQTYWAQNRTEDLIKLSIANSECYGAYLKNTNRQIALARVVTDYVSVFYICDVVVDQEYRGNGIGKELIHAIVSDERFINLRGLLATSQAHKLYEKYGFARATERYMSKEPGVDLIERIDILS